MGKDSNHRGSAVARTRFARIDHDILRSAAYRALSPTARVLLLEFAMIYNTRNNGQLYLSVRDAADLIGVSDLKTAGAAFDELESLGFIVMTADAHFAVKAGGGSRARSWRLTWAPMENEAATLDYRTAIVRGGKPAKRARLGGRALDRRQKIKSPVEDSSTLNTKRVEQSRTTTTITGGEAPPVVLDCSTQNAPTPQITVDGRRSGILHTLSYATTGGPLGEALDTPETPQNGGGIFSGAVLRPKLLAELRADLAFHIEREGYGGQKAIAAAAQVPAPVLSRFRYGHNLPGKYYAGLKLEIDRLDKVAGRSIRKRA